MATLARLQAIECERDLIQDFANQKMKSLERAHQAESRAVTAEAGVDVVIERQKAGVELERLRAGAELALAAAKQKAEIEFLQLLRAADQDKQRLELEKKHLEHRAELAERGRGSLSPAGSEVGSLRDGFRSQRQPLNPDSHEGEKNA